MIIPLQDPHKPLVRTAAGRQIMQRLLEGCKDVPGKYRKPDKLLQHPSIDQFPFLAMGSYPVAIFHKSEQMSQFMDQGNEKRVFIQTAIYANPMILSMGSMPVISQNTLPFFRYSKMHFIVMQVFQYQWSCFMGNKLPEIVERGFFLRHFFG